MFGKHMLVYREDSCEARPILNEEALLLTASLTHIIARFSLLTHFSPLWRGYGNSHTNSLYCFLKYVTISRQLKAGANIIPHRE